MAKSSRSSSRKTNNQRLKAKVFGPIEAERNARLSAKLLELVTAPKPEADQVNGETMNIVDENEDATAAAAATDDTAMDIDAAKNAVTSSKSTRSSSKKGRIEKRRKTSKIVFQKYSDKSKKKKQ